MTKMIFVNLPVAEIAHAKAFYEAVGFVNNAQFSDDSSACMVWSETIHVMLHTHAKWQGFTSRPIPAATTSEVMIALSCASRADVDQMNDVAASHGGSADINPKQDLGFMFNRSFADPDGHVFEAVWMDPAALPPAA
jgi:hypothetical protein